MFGRLLPLRDDVTNSASIGPTDTGRPSNRLNVADMVSDTGEPPSQPIRMPAYAQLVVSSTDRYNDFIGQLTAPTTSSNWVLNRPNYLLQGYFSRLALTQIQIQWNLDTICNSSAPGVSIGNDIIPYSLNISTVTTSQTIDPTAGDVTLTVTAGLAFINGNAIRVSSGGNSFNGIILSYTSTTLVITSITDILGTYPATATWTVTSDNIYSTTVAPGFWSPTQLASNLQAVMNADIGSAVMTVTYALPTDAFAFGTSVGNFKFACASGYKIIFLPSFTATSGNANTTQNRTLNTIGANYYNCHTLSSVQQFSPPTMSYTRWIDICSSTLTKFQRVKDATTLPADAHTATLARVYLTPPNVSQNSSFGAGILNGLPFNFTVDFANPKYIKWSPREVISNFDIQVRDEFGQLLYWTANNGIEFQFTLLASES